jgi:multisubunit Na+/H+ antiporter MnhF subunit
MNAFLWAGAAMAALLVPCGMLAMRGAIMDRVLALQLGSAIATLGLLALAEGFNRSIYFDLALVYGVSSFLATLALVRFLERWV